jgi:hypothetical protein
MTAGTPLTLTGGVAPDDATNQAIVWSVKDAAGTAATITNCYRMSAANAGNVVVTATVVNGATAATDYIQDFAITVSPAAPAPSGGGGGDGGYNQPAEPETPAEAADTDTIDDESVPLAEPGAIWDNPFIDVKEEDWFYNDVEYTHIRGLIMGTSGNTFSPITSTTRGMIVTILYRHAGSPDVSTLANPFSDAAGKYYTDAVKWAAANNIVAGVGGGYFEPEAPVTRQDLAAILNRYAGFAGMKLPVTRAYTAFNDDADIAGYAREAIEKFFAAAIIEGKGNGIADPKGTATRAEVASMLHRFLEIADKG